MRRMNGLEREKGREKGGERERKKERRKEKERKGEREKGRLMDTDNSRLVAEGRGGGGGRE